MSDEENDAELPPQRPVKSKAVKPREDWDPDAFPTSAKPVFRGTALLVAIILGLCYLVYSTSEHPEEEERELKKLSVEDDFLADEQIEE